MIGIARYDKITCVEMAEHVGIRNFQKFLLQVKGLLEDDGIFFEVHRVENSGAHYAVTIQKWLANWERNEEAIVAAYGARWFRLWRMFLAWSVHIGGQGSSALLMLTLTKNTKNDRSTVSPEEAPRQAFSRRHRWIGPAPVETQQ